MLAEPEADAVAQRLQGARLSAPALLGFELANVCLMKIRRQHNKREALRNAFRFARKLNISLTFVDYEAVLDLAEATGLTAYDASYLWLARSLGAELIALDRKLAAASFDAGERNQASDYP